MDDYAIKAAHLGAKAVGMLRGMALCGELPEHSRRSVGKILAEWDTLHEEQRPSPEVK